MSNFIKIGQPVAEILQFFDFFHDGVRPPSWICLGHIWTTHEQYLVVFMGVLKLQDRTRREVLQKDCQACKLNTEDAINLSRWKKLIKGWLMIKIGVSVTLTTCIANGAKQ